MMNTIIERSNGGRYDLEEMNIFTRDFIVSSPAYSHTSEKIEGMQGEVDLGSTLDPRDITVKLYFDAGDLDSFTNKRNELFDLFESTESFYITDSREPGKRWLVKLSSSFETEQQRHYGLLELELIAFKGYAESTGTTVQAATFKHLENLPVDYTDYSLHATNFRIFNAGAEINPRSINDTLIITYIGESENLRIENKTTGDVWQHKGSSNPDDKIVLDGIRSTKNNLSIFRDTNKRLISLAPGWNEFEISGAPDARRYAVQAHMPRKSIPDELKPNPITFEFKYNFN